MVRYLIVFVGVAAVIWFAVSYTGYVIVRDETGLAQNARVKNSVRQQELTDLTFGYFAAIPEVEGEVEVRCSDGSTVSGSYVAKHWKEKVKVTGERMCQNLVQL